jgi:hypothetical protein
VASIRSTAGRRELADRVACALFKGSKEEKVADDHEFVLEGFLLYAVVGVPLILGMLVCRGRSGFARICIVAFAIAIVWVGVSSVYAAMRGEPWEYVSQRTGQYIDLLGGTFLLGTIVGAIWALPSRRRDAGQQGNADDGRNFAEVERAMLRTGEGE